jgi:hypothetical protein
VDLEILCREIDVAIVPEVALGGRQNGFAASDVQDGRDVPRHHHVADVESVERIRRCDPVLKGKRGYGARVVLVVRSAALR